MDQKLSLSSHILDTSRGKPADNVDIKLFKLVNNNWIKSSSSGVTDNDGRLKDFNKIEQTIIGTYKLRFDVEEYFQRLGVESLYQFIEVSISLLSQLKCFSNCVNIYRLFSKYHRILNIITFLCFSIHLVIQHIVALKMNNCNNPIHWI